MQDVCLSSTVLQHHNKGLSLWDCKPQSKCFPLLEVPWSWGLFRATETINNMEVGTSNWSFSVIGQIMLLLKGIWILGLMIRKEVQSFNCCLVGQTSRSRKTMVPSTIWTMCDCIKRFQKRRIEIGGLETLFVVFSWRIRLPFPYVKSSWG